MIQMLEGIKYPAGPPPTPPPAHLSLNPATRSEWMEAVVVCQKYVVGVRKYQLAAFCLKFLQSPYEITNEERDRMMFTLCLLVLDPAPQDLVSQLTGISGMKLPYLADIGKDS